MTTRRAIHFFFVTTNPKIGLFFSFTFLAQQIMPIMQITVQFSCLTTYIVIYCGLDTRSAIDAPPIPPIVGMAQTTYPDVLPNHQNTSDGIGLSFTPCIWVEFYSLTNNGFSHPL